MCAAALLCMAFASLLCLLCMESECIIICVQAALLAVVASFLEHLPYSMIIACCSSIFEPHTSPLILTALLRCYSSARRRRPLAGSPAVGAFPGIRRVGAAQRAGRARPGARGGSAGRPPADQRPFCGRPGVHRAAQGAGHARQVQGGALDWRQMEWGNCAACRSQRDR